jgi:hypothetical protein
LDGTSFRTSSKMKCSIQLDNVSLEQMARVLAVLAVLAGVTFTLCYEPSASSAFTPVPPPQQQQNKRVRLF